jgi:SNF2 family DNA or RNA helicase
MLDQKGTALDHEEQIQAIRNLSRSMATRVKNKILLKIIRGAPGKIIIFVKYMGTLEHISDYLAWEKIPHAVSTASMKNADQRTSRSDEFQGNKPIFWSPRKSAVRDATCSFATR